MKTVCVRIVVKTEQIANMLIDDLHERLSDLPGLVTQLDMEDASEKETEMFEKID